ncbi:MAG TPA: sigma-70 family RNA polymerase sigma factor [Gemmataceae bacterium]|nr:sigma-70 family RNA polymerase sigma factor [Gemmataceae bacterium]
MPAQSISRLFAQLRQSAPADPTTDAALLDRFLGSRDEGAFTTLVHRHAPMVLGVCRRILGNEADAEDACQATFLVFVRKARSIRPRGMVGGWLYGVARNTARRARLMAARRRQHEAEARPFPRASGVDEELREVIDRALERLPARCKAAIVLCDLEGLTRDEAARRLGWPAGTVASRLARGRRLLAGRLTRAGVGASVVVGAALVGSASAVPPRVIDQLHSLAKCGQVAASPAVLALTHGVLRTMTLQRLSLVAAGVFLAAGLILAVRTAMPSASAQAPVAAAVRVAAVIPVKDGDDSITVQNLPPVVVKTAPSAGADDVDPAVSEIKVTFSKEMTDQSWSWSQLSDESFPKTLGDKPIHYEKDKRTCVMKVKLEPGKTYAIWLNSEKFTNFKDADGRSAIPYLLVFKTKKTD